MTNSNSSAPLTVIFLTFDCEDVIARVVEAARPVATRLLAVDSYSKDKTLEILKSLGVEVLSHPFENYAAQRNWAQAQAGLNPDDWVLHLDADEVLTPELADSIKAALAAPKADQADGYMMKRITHFLGQRICWGHMNPNWHLRLYKAGLGKCEERLYDQHYVCTGRIAKLKGVMDDLQLISIERWTATHNRWSTEEAKEIIANAKHEGEGQLQARFFGDPRQRKRWLKNKLYYVVPPLIRPMLLFFYNYLIRLGILDGRVGLIYHVLHAFWFRFLVDAKVIERRMEMAKAKKSS